MTLRSLLLLVAFVVGFRSLPAAEPIRLVVPILVDQLRYDYLERFYDHFGEGGFKRLLAGGAFLTQAHYDYCPTVTGPGHASFLSGSPPSINGIIANDWFDRASGKPINCVQDGRVSGVGTTAASARRSPRNFIGSTVSDEMRLRFQSKVVGISIKDRGAILPAGKRPTGAYWFESESGKFVTSDYYMDALPDWVVAFNGRERAKFYLGQTWDRLLPADQYPDQDDAPGEASLSGEKTVTFPHVAVIPEKPGYDNIVPTPFGNELVEELAEAAIEGEKLGQGEQPDLLAISFSSIDAAGHRFGPYSQEIQDMVLRLDRTLARLLDALDQKVGLGRVLIVLTADHGVAPTPEWARAHGLDGERIDEIPFMADLLGKLSQHFGPGHYLARRSFFAGNLYFDYAALAQKNLAPATVAAFIRDWAMESGKFSACFSRDELLTGQAPGDIGRRVVNGFYPPRSGDVVLIFKPYQFPYDSKGGTTHGSPFTYDTHVPVIFFGHRFKAGRYADPFNITDIAPTLSAALRIEAPAGAIGQPLTKVLADP